MIKITFPDGVSKSYKVDITPYEIASSISEGLARNVISASFNDQTIETSTKLKENGKLVFYTWKDEEGKKAFWHSSAHVLAQVLEEFYTDIKLTIGPAIKNGFYYDVDFGKHILSEKDFPRIEKRMIEISREKHLFKLK
jgi:threonyl-tRNA synthetase